MPYKINKYRKNTDWKFTDYLRIHFLDIFGLVGNK